jgi:hypothetical protein
VSRWDRLNGSVKPDPALVAMTAELVRAGMVDLPGLGDVMVAALLRYQGFEGDHDLQRRIYDEYEIRYLLCDDCPSLLLGGGLVKRRYRVVHEATCPTWLRYQKRQGGYTAMPSGVVVRPGEKPPPGTTVLLSNRPGNPCGAVVTHRGPYRRPADQEAARASALRAS